ncbi:hypothetical protein NEOLEDRAFT_1083136 [Neolentinus lepideus HHB14362 ss-1]|uniref:Alpha/beta-hydrolase n=1 Tax=Neolentinus lepideus HHB14362 ss-1 TaxID=1314782 RepID=A0A165W758_9AGAM|nr:hypothetical protein NEOLEDRAFT_1083136 [Neolentinus lepideus HHB14362 ss-1]
MASESLPPFLQLWPTDLPVAVDASEPCQNAVYRHSDPLGSSHVLWWPFATALEPSAEPTVILFIPGNPGLLGFYTPFLSTLYEKAVASGSTSLAILAHSYLGHTPGLVDRTTFSHPERVGLTSQVHALVEVVDSIKSIYGAGTRIVLVGHSVGTWTALQVLKARHDGIAEVFLLFPTITHIVKTPNGRRLWWLFKRPFPRLVSTASPLTRLLPLQVFSVILGDWPSTQLQVLLKLVHSPPCVFSALTMANDEMETIRELDIVLLDENRHRICIYFGDRDHWVGEQREAILRVFNPEPDSVRVVHGHSDIPHAFCINHGEPVAEQCYEWLKSASLI